MRIVLIQNPDIVSLSDSARTYLQDHSKYSIHLKDNTNLSETIADAYLLGIRHFILSITSGEILTISDLILKLTDSIFIAPASTLVALRGFSSNLYFTSASNTYIDLVAQTFKVYNPCLVYDQGDDPYVMEVIRIFQQNNIPTFPVTDLSWQDYFNLLLVSVNNDVWSLVNNEIGSGPLENYSMYGFEIYPSNTLVFNPKVINVAVLFPKATIKPQLNSYWNIVVKDLQFNICSNITSSYPLLTNIDWTELASLNLISSSLQINGYYFSDYLVLFPIDLKYNLHNNHRKGGCYIWLIDATYVNPETVFNYQYLQKVNPQIVTVRVVVNFSKAVCKYWKQGYRHFILDAPSEKVKSVQALKLERGVFICPRSTDPLIRHPGSAFFFGLTDDTTMIQSKLQGVNRSADNKLVCVLGSSNNINIRDFRRNLDMNGIQWIENLNDLPLDTVILYSVGNDTDFEVVLDYVSLNREKYPALSALRKYGLYVTQNQSDRLQTLFGPDLYCEINFNSSQPYLDSKYSTFSRPLYLVDYTEFLYLSNILFQLPLRFLFDFGYLIDI